jgi:hypothetical protein
MKSSWTLEQRQTAEPIIAKIAAVQTSRKLSNTQLLAEFPDLGSIKTWNDRLKTGEFQGLNATRMLAKLARIDVILEGGQPDTITYADLPFTRAVRARVNQLERNTNDRRILVILAPNGTGKTTVARWCVHQARASRAYLRMRPSWRNKGIHIANGIARALGATADFSDPAKAEQACVDLLLGNPRTLFIDQAHEGGAALMHILRSLVDETISQPRARFVYLGYRTAWDRVLNSTTDSMMEARAFTGRCIKPVFDVYRDGTHTEDVVYFLQKCGDLSISDAKGLALRITPALARDTNLRLLEDAIESARAGSESDEATAETIERAVYQLSGLDPANREASDPV